LQDLQPAPAILEGRALQALNDGLAKIQQARNVGIGERLPPAVPAAGLVRRSGRARGLT